MSTEIIAKLGLNDDKFANGLRSAESKFSTWTSRIRSKTVEVLNGKSLGTSSVDMALRAAQRAAEKGAEVASKIKLRLTRQPEVDVRQSSVDIALRAQEAARRPKPPPVLPPQPGAEEKATGILGLFRKKFSSTEVFKDVARGAGVGFGIGFVLDRIIGFFRNAAERAQALQSHTERMVDISRSLEGALNGPRRELELQVKEANELNAAIELQRRLLESLKSAPAEFLNDEYRAQVNEAEDKMRSLIEKQAQLAAGAKTLAHQENLRTEALQRQQVFETNMANLELQHAVEGRRFKERRDFLKQEEGKLREQGALPSSIQANLNQQKALDKEEDISKRNRLEKEADLKRAKQLNDEITDAELRDASEVEKKRIRLNALLREEKVLKERTGLFSAEVTANQNEQQSLRNEIRVDQKSAGEDRRRILVGLGSSLAGSQPGRLAQRRPRGRSERERIADRGKGFIDRADEAVRTGSGSPEYVAHLMRAGRIDLESVGGRVAASASKIGESESNSLSNEFAKATASLKNIERALRPEKTK
jgi:hypothetical protein